MGSLLLTSIKDLQTSEIEIDDAIFNVVPHDQALYHVVNAQRAALRQGTHSTKNRSEVSGGGKKPYRQKGTGRARQGSIRATQWVGGGIQFGPKPRDYNQKINKKVRQLAFRSALSLHYQNKTLIVLDSFSLESAKTKEAAALLKKLGVDGKVLFAAQEYSDEFIQACRNIPTVYISYINHLSTLEILSAKWLVFDRSCLAYLKGVLK
jgi:large subunit ribosomal protein L4